MSDENTTAKQDYLRTEILDANYDASLFSDFLNSKKGGAGLTSRRGSGRGMLDVGGAEAGTLR